MATHSETTMSVNAPKPEIMPPIDYADHTVEVDTRWLFTDRPDSKVRSGSSEARTDEDPRDGADLTPAQINELLNARK